MSVALTMLIAVLIIFVVVTLWLHRVETARSKREEETLKAVGRVEQSMQILADASTLSDDEKSRPSKGFSQLSIDGVFLYAFVMQQIKTQYDDIVAKTQVVDIATGLCQNITYCITYIENIIEVTFVLQNYSKTQLELWFDISEDMRVWVEDTTSIISSVQVCTPTECNEACILQVAAELKDIFKAGKVHYKARVPEPSTRSVYNLVRIQGNLEVIPTQLTGLVYDKETVDMYYKPPTVHVGNDRYYPPMSKIVDLLAGIGFRGRSAIITGMTGVGKSTVLKYVIHETERYILQLSIEDLGIMATPEGKGVILNFLASYKDVILIIDEAQGLVDDSKFVAILELMDGIAKATCPDLTVILALNTKVESLNPTLSRAGRTTCIIDVVPQNESGAANIAALASKQGNLFQDAKLQGFLQQPTVGEVTLAEIIECIIVLEDDPLAPIRKYKLDTI